MPIQLTEQHIREDICHRLRILIEKSEEGEIALPDVVEKLEELAQKGKDFINQED